MKYSAYKIITGFIVALALFYPVYLFFAGISFRFSVTTPAKLHIDIKVKTNRSQTFELFYDFTTFYNPEKLKSIRALGMDHFQDIHFELPEQLHIKGLKLAFEPGADTIFINSITFRYGSRSLEWNTDSIIATFHSNDLKMEKKGTDVLLVLQGTVPFIATAIDFSPTYNQLVDRTKSPAIAFIFAFIFSLFFFLIIVNSRFSIKPGNLILHDSYPKTLVLTFLALLCAPVFFMQFPVGKNVHELEKRFRIGKPGIKLESLADYPENFTAFFNDNFGLRTQLIRINNAIHIRFLYTYWLKNKVMLGKDGWLFIAADNAAEYYRNANRFTEEQLAQIKEILEEKNAWLEQNGIAFYFMMPPMSSTIYPEYLPESIRKVHPQSRLEQVYSYLAEHHTRVKIVDVRKALLEEKKKRMVYYKTDFHWNIPGAFVACRELLNHMREDFGFLQPDNFSNYTLKQFTSYDADLAVMLSLPQQFPREHVTMTPKVKYKARIVDAPKYPFDELLSQPTVVMMNDSSKNPNLVMFCDSYAIFMEPFLSENFSRSVYLWTNHFIPEIVRIEKPKIVVQEIVERFLDDLLLKNPEWMKAEIQAYQNKIRMMKDQSEKQKTN